jgi:hypothetical protein
MFNSHSGNRVSEKFAPGLKIEPFENLNIDRDLFPVFPALSQTFWFPVLVQP